MMDKLKRFITPVIATFMALSMPLLVHAADSSVLIYPGEGNSTCNDYAPNKLIETMGTSSPVATDTVYGSENTNDSDADYPDTSGESATYIISDTNSFSFDSTTPIDFAVLKGSEGVSIFMLPQGGLTTNDSMVLTDDLGNPLEISAFSLCYGLGYEPVPPPPENLPPVLDSIVDKEVTVGNPVTFDVNATDDMDLIDDTVTITASPDANFTYSGDNGIGGVYGTFSWIPTAADVGSSNVTFIASDGSLMVSQTISITVIPIPPVQVALPACESLTTSAASDSTYGLPVLDKTAIVCPGTTERALVCNFELDEPMYGLGVTNDSCCICNNASTGLVSCNPDLPAGDDLVDGEYPCMPDPATKIQNPLHPLEVTTHFELNSDPYYCYTSGGRRICFMY